MHMLVVHTDTHARVVMKNMLLFKILSFLYLACKSSTAIATDNFLNYNILI